MDCSAAFEIAKGSPKGMGFKMLLDEGEPIIAPSFLFNEAANVAWKLTIFGDATREQAKGLLENALMLIDDFVEPAPYYKEVYEAACQNDHAAYDFFYLLLAKRNGATLFTADKKLIQLCEEMGVNTVAEIDF